MPALGKGGYGREFWNRRVGQRQGDAGGGRIWSGAWAGLCNTHFWVDRTTGITASIYSNLLPFGTPEAFALYQDFERALYAAL